MSLIQAAYLVTLILLGGYTASVVIRLRQVEVERRQAAEDDWLDGQLDDDESETDGT